MKGLGPRKSVDKLSEDEEVEVSMSDDLVIAISRNRNNGSDSLGNSSTTPDKKSMDTHSSELSRNGDDDGDEGEDDDGEEGHEEVAKFQRGTTNSSFSRRSSLRTAVRDKRSSRRNYSLKKKKEAASAAKVAPEVQFESQPASCWSVDAKRHAAASIPSPCSSLSSVSIMSATAPVAHPKAIDALPPSVRAEDLRLNLNSLDSSSACSDFKSMEGNSLDIVESTRL